MAATVTSIDRSGAGKTRIGRYWVGAKLGQGAMGTVYRADDPLIERKVALKVLSVDLGGEERARFREHFFSEGKSAGRLNHPNIVTVYDIGESDGVPYIAMEFLQGFTLREALDTGTVMPVRRVVDIGLAVCRGLDFAHGQGVIHRDIKPANIMLTRNGMVKIMDFGIARSASAVSLDTSLPRGQVIGSPKYMAPEQLQGREVDARSDLFSLGVTLYELLVGCNPFDAPTINEVVERVLHHHPAPPRERNPDVPRELDLLVLRAMHKDPARRYASAREMARVLRMLRRELRTHPEGGRSVPLPASPSADRGGATVVLGVPPADTPRRPGGSKRLVVGVAVVLLAAGAAATWLQRGLTGRPAPPEAPPPAAAGAAALADVDVFAPPILPLPPVDETPAVVIDAPSPPPAATPSPSRRAAPAVALQAGPAAVEGAARIVLAVLPWGQVYVDGKLAGVTPPLRELTLPPGRHRVEIRNLDFPPFIAEVQLESEREQTLRHRFGQ